MAMDPISADSGQEPASLTPAAMREEAVFARCEWNGQPRIKRAPGEPWDGAGSAVTPSKPRGHSHGSVSDGVLLPGASPGAASCLPGGQALVPMVPTPMGTKRDWEAPELGKAGGGGTGGGGSMASRRVVCSSWEDQVQLYSEVIPLQLGTQ